MKHLYPKHAKSRPHMIRRMPPHQPAAYPEPHIHQRVKIVRLPTSIFLPAKMISRIATLVSAIILFTPAIAEVAPEITTVAEGYNVIAKLPCVGCPFLYQDTSKGSDGPWTQREDVNAMVRLSSRTAYHPILIKLAALEHLTPLRLSTS